MTPGRRSLKSFSSQVVEDLPKLLEEDLKDNKDKDTTAGSFSYQEVVGFLKVLDEDHKDRKDKDKAATGTLNGRRSAISTGRGTAPAA